MSSWELKHICLRLTESYAAYSFFCCVYDELEIMDYNLSIYHISKTTMKQTFFKISF